MTDLARQELKYLHGVGPRRSQLLEQELHLHSCLDLLHYFPFRYIDRSKFYRLADLQALRGETTELPYMQFRGRFVSFAAHGEGRRRRLNALFTDGTGTIEVVWFQRVKSIQETYHTGQEYVLFGKPEDYRGKFNLVHPEVDAVKPGTQPQGGLVGVYNLTEKLRNRNFTSRTMQKLVATLLESANVAAIPDHLPSSLIERYRLMPLGQALINMHLPQSVEALTAAQRRLKYDELLCLQVHILHDLKSTRQRMPGFVFVHVGQYFNEFYQHHMAFPLTGAQKRVIREIRHDMGSGRQMNRLLQGDVGSGKTIVAFLCMLLALDNGYQACIMAPTEILAQQHFESLSAMAAPLGINVRLLTGSTRGRERTAIHEQLLSGELQILIGTHALIEDTVKFRNLGLAVIDEQHRFGVAQRAKLWSKNVTPPHVLVMTATPIPRTLSMTVYGDLDVSVIDELPPGRKPVTTRLRYDNKRQEVYHFIGTELRKGRQCYIVYPLIEESEKLDLKAVEDGFESIKEIFPHYRVCMVHGRMKPAEKDHQMQLFASGQAQILVATTVIEVGVNVPNASVMVIEDAQRFGLSQLHQLRGRVGRGADQSYCILMAKTKLSGESRHRLEVMCETNDGFRVAEEDMKLRGPGDIEGTQQSGIAFDLKVANLATDGAVVQAARDDAQALLEADPDLTAPQNRPLAAQVRSLYGHQLNWSLIS